jgi:hypothetical protein
MEIRNKIKFVFKQGCKTKTKTEKLKDTIRETLSQQTKILSVYFHYAAPPYMHFIFTSSQSIRQ